MSATSAPVLRACPARTGRPTILLVDHEPAILAPVRDCLGDAGYRLVAVAHPDDALVALRSFRFALVLAGTCTGVGRGDDPWAAVERLRAAAGGTPVAIFTAHHPRVYADFRERGYADRIAKPSELDAFLAACLDVVGEFLMASYVHEKWPTYSRREGGSVPRHCSRSRSADFANNITPGSARLAR